MTSFPVTVTVCHRFALMNCFHMYDVDGVGTVALGTDSSSLTVTAANKLFQIIRMIKLIKCLKQ